MYDEYETPDTQREEYESNQRDEKYDALDEYREKETDLEHKAEVEDDINRDKANDMKI